MSIVEKLEVIFTFLTTRAPEGNASLKVQLWTVNLK